MHAVQPAAISISQATEVGTIYRPDEIAALAEAARRHHMIVHVDGARFANALVSLGKTPAEITWKAGVDVLSFGATKNGCVAAEAIVLFRTDKAQELGYRRKRGGHLLSKSRFLAAQLEAYLTDDLWLGNARHANAMARRLAAGWSAASACRPLQPVETNQVFVAFDARVAASLRAAGFLFHDWPALGAGACRLVTSFETSTAAVDALVAAAGHGRGRRQQRRSVAHAGAAHADAALAAAGRRRRRREGAASGRGGRAPRGAMPSSGARNCPVYEPGTRATSSGVPAAITSPPPEPPSGPRSMM